MEDTRRGCRRINTGRYTPKDEHEEDAQSISFNQLIIWNWSKLIKQSIRCFASFRSEHSETGRLFEAFGTFWSRFANKEVQETGRTGCRSILNFNLSYEFIIFVGLFMMLVCDFGLMAVVGLPNEFGYRGSPKLANLRDSNSLKPSRTSMNLDARRS